MNLSLLNTYPTDERRKDDFYRTPSDCADIGALLTTPTGIGVLDPCAGDGALLDAVARWRPDVTRVGIEIDPVRAAASHSVVGDALLIPWPHADVILMNPPFSLWQGFVTKAIAQKSVRIVVVLLRLGALASQKRKKFWQSIATPWGVTLHILTKRPSFTGGGSDNSDYARIVLSRDPQETGVRWV